MPETTEYADNARSFFTLKMNCICHLLNCNSVLVCTEKVLRLLALPFLLLCVNDNCHVQIYNRIG